MISEKVVVIDDDNRIIKSLQLVFNEYEIIGFNNGYEALEFLKGSHAVNLVLLDVMMPKVNGLTVLSEIKKANHSLAVIIMTAYGTKDVILQALRNHADDFIEKPFKIDELKSKIRTLLKGRLYPQKPKINDQEYISRIKRFIERNSHNVTLASVARELCLSPKYVSRMFNKKSDSGFREYKVMTKIDQAKDFLKGSTLSVSEISNKLGYQNPESFMRLFKRMTQMTPMEYRLTQRT